MYKTLSGREPAAAILEEAKRTVAPMKKKPVLAIVLVGSDPASELYVRKKMEKAEAVGVWTRMERLPEDVSEEKLRDLVDRLNSDPQIHGFIVQSPLPKHID